MATPQDAPARSALPRWRVRPEVTFPAWDHVTAPVARDALLAIMRAFGIEKCWDGYGADEDAVRVAVLRRFASTGGAPSRSEIAGAAGVDADRLPALLESLDRRDLLVLDPATGDVAGAYPFTVTETGHRVGLGGVTLNAMCAIDALGTGAMFGRDVFVVSSCRACGAPVAVTVTEAGGCIAGAAPRDAVVWSGVRYANNRAATSMCTVMAFFCDDAHLEAWRTREHPEVQGYRLTLEEARQVGAAIFAPMLANTG